MRILDRSQVEQLLPMRDAVDAMATALGELARGGALQPLRQAHWLPDRRGVLGVMPGFLPESGALGLKVISVFAHDPGSKLESHQGGVLLFDAATGTPSALVDAGAITAIRTAAVTAVATDRLARRDVTTLALLGSGTQARTHLEALRLVRPFDRVRVWSRTAAHAEAFAREQARRHGIAVEPVAGIADAVAGADVVCTLTASREPFFGPELLEPGMHVNSVGASVPAFRELRPQVLPAVRLFTDRRESLAHEAWEFLEAVRDGLVTAGAAVELGEVLAGLRPGRQDDDEVTLFRSLGLAIEDLAAAQLVLARARERGLGTEVELGG